MKGLDDSKQIKNHTKKKTNFGHEVCLNFPIFNLTFKKKNFTDLALWARSVIELPCPTGCLSVFLCVQSQKTPYWVSWKHLVKGRIANISIQ